jgi:serine/threonine-protein kinase ULK/ATG1
MPTPLPNAPVTPGMSPQTIATREEDEEVKPYVVVAEIGKGSFATVYKGFHQVRSIAHATHFGYLSRSVAH